MMIIYSNYFVEVPQVLQRMILFSKPLAVLTLFHQQLQTINKNVYVSIVSGITKSWIYYQFYHKEWAEKLATRAVKKYFNNEKKNIQMNRLEKNRYLISKKDKERYFCSKFFLVKITFIV